MAGRSAPALYKVESQSRPVIDCAHEGCQRTAICREQTPTGWANLCYSHWIAHGKAEQKKWREDRGIFTKQQLKDYIGTGKVFDRVPGSDDE